MMEKMLKSKKVSFYYYTIEFLDTILIIIKEQKLITSETTLIVYFVLLKY